MVSLEEFRERKAREFRGILARPGMYAPDASSMFATMAPLVADLVDLYDLKGDDAAYQPVARERFDEYGVPGIERWFARPASRCAPEVASLYGEVASRIGLLEIADRVSPEDWDAIGFGNGELFRSRDWCLSEITSRLPSPSLVVGKRVWCYAQHDPSAGWVYLDFEREPTGDPLLRDVRLPTAKAVDGLVFTPSGRRYDNRRITQLGAELARLDAPTARRVAARGVEMLQEHFPVAGPEITAVISALRANTAPPAELVEALARLEVAERTSGEDEATHSWGRSRRDRCRLKRRRHAVCLECLVLAG